MDAEDEVEDEEEMDDSMHNAVPSAPWGSFGKRRGGSTGLR
jgi:hypothetical protein